MRFSIYVLSLVFFTPAIFGDGVKLFEQNCGKCHTMSYQGTTIGKGKGGPDLTGLKAKRPVGYILLYVRDPAAAQAKYPDIYNSQIKGKFRKSMKKIGESAVSDSELSQILDMIH